MQANLNLVRYYVRDKHHRLRNAPYVDNSCKWAGGGFLSNVHDLVRFGNAMLYSFQHAEVPPSFCHRCLIRNYVLNTIFSVWHLATMI